MTGAKLARLLIIGLALLACLASAGCFDYEMEMALTKSGKGSVNVSLSLPEDVASSYTANSLETLVFPMAKRSRGIANGRLVIKETCEFENLDDLAVRHTIFRVREMGTGVLGLGNYLYRVIAQVEMPEGYLPNRDVLPGTEREARQPQAPSNDPAQQRLRQLRARSLAGHYVTIALKFPGTVDKAEPLVVGASKVEPVVQEGGQRVAWKIPLAVLFNENVRDTLELTAFFKGYMEFRAYEQKHADSHYPDRYDEALGRGENPGMTRTQYLQRLGLVPPR